MVASLGVAGEEDNPGSCSMEDVTSYWEAVASRRVAAALSPSDLAHNEELIVRRVASSTELSSDYGPL